MIAWFYATHNVPYLSARKRVKIADNTRQTFLSYVVICIFTYVCVPVCLSVCVSSCVFVSVCVCCIILDFVCVALYWMSASELASYSDFAFVGAVEISSIGL